MEVSLDYSLRTTAIAFVDNRPYVKVHAFAYEGHDRYVIYKLEVKDSSKYQIKNDCLLEDLQGIYHWLIEHTHIKTIEEAEDFTLEEIWWPEYEDSYLEARMQ